MDFPISVLPSRSFNVFRSTKLQTLQRPTTMWLPPGSTTPTQTRPSHAHTQPSLCSGACPPAAGGCLSCSTVASSDRLSRCNMTDSSLAGTSRPCAQHSTAIATLVGLDQRRAKVPIALPCDPQSVRLASRGVLANIHSSPGHQLAGMGEPLHITNLGDHRQRKQVLDAPKADQ